MKPSKKKKLFSKLGDPRMPGGAIYVGRNKEGINQAFEDSLRESLRMQGIPVDKTAKREVRKFVRKMMAEKDATLTAMGIPDCLKQVFETEKKSDLEKLARHTVVKQIDLVAFIHNCKSLGFRHEIKRKEFVPESVILGKKEFEALKQNGVGPMSKEAQKVVSKTQALFEQRKVNIGHLFFKENEWHCLYFSYKDMSPRDNHWKHGPHMHYTNSRIMDWSRRKMGYALDERDLTGIRNIHIRFEDKRNKETLETNDDN
jgi:hypothetical protein